jgi:hypothetical protein
MMRVLRSVPWRPVILSTGTLYSTNVNVPTSSREFCCRRESHHASTGLVTSLQKPTPATFLVSGWRRALVLATQTLVEKVSWNQNSRATGRDRQAKTKNMITISFADVSYWYWYKYRGKLSRCPLFATKKFSSSIFNLQTSVSMFIDCCTMTIVLLVFFMFQCVTV